MILDALVYKYRWMARYLVHYEVLSTWVQGLVPFDLGDVSSIFLLMLMVQTYITVACN